MNRRAKIWRLFLTFLKIGALTFGGGYAMIPLIQREMVEQKKWITDDDILEIIAIAESTPGPIAINAATFVGYRVAGFFGAFFGYSNCFPCCFARQSSEAGQFSHFGSPLGRHTVAPNSIRAWVKSPQAPAG